MADIDRKPLPELSGEIREKIIDAIVSGYDVADLSQVLQFKLGLVLRNYFNPHQGFHYIVTELVDWAERKGKTQELLAVAYSGAPGNPRLQSIAAIYDVSLQQVGQKYGAHGLVAKPASLEALVNKHSRLIDYARFIRRLQNVGARICLVQTPYKKGTGFLIGPDCALTNYHVVEDVIFNKLPATEIVCQFDYQACEGNDSPVALKVYRLRADGIVAHSPVSESDRWGKGDPEPDKLDYAVLKLAEPVANKRADEPRGWFELSLDRAVIALRDFIVIPQHAEAQPLQIAWGSIVEFPGAGHRMRYDTTTAPGSSGSPCFTADLDLAALHQAADPKYNPVYNQAVPLWLVADDLRRKELCPELIRGNAPFA